MNENEFVAIIEPIIAKAKKSISHASNDMSKSMPIIAIAGGPGAGKTHFTARLQAILQQEGFSVATLEQDNFLLYNETDFDVLPHINPRLKWKQLNQSLQEIAARKEHILLPFRNKTARPFSTEYKTVPFGNIDVVLFEGKHALSGPETFNFFSHCSFGIFIDAHSEHMNKWKTERELARPQHTQKDKELFDKQLIWGMEIYQTHIEPTKKNASFVMYHDTHHSLSLIKGLRDDE